MTKMSQLRQKGFTIIELLIVIVIIGLLALLVLNNVGGATADARDAQRKDDIAKLATQLEIYNNKESRYPTGAQLVGTEFTDVVDIDAEVLIDPDGVQIGTTGSDYSYTVEPAGCDNTATDCESFTLTATLENQDDNGGVFTKQSSL
jgi:prepilin-type N-terminal cleavage/methylation domain-containing protein